MKRQTSLWGSISVLIGVIVGIVALVRGPAFYPMILLAFAVCCITVEELARS